MRQLKFGEWFFYTILCMMSLWSCVPLWAQAKGADELQTVTLQMQKAPLPEILAEIEKQTGVTFSYESSLLKEFPKTSFKAVNEVLPDCLSRLFAALPVVYSITGKIVVLKRKPKQVTISGFVRDNTSAESLIGASVYDVGSRKGTASNSYGFFSLTLPAGPVLLHASYIGYENRTYMLSSLDRDTVLTIGLIPNAALQEVVITASDHERQPVHSTQMGVLEVNQATIRATPVLFGESDIIRTLQLTPGVAAGTEGVAGMYVRGGNVDENLFLIDGNPVYQVNHIGGIFSAFNSEAVRGMEFFKAGFPARFGGRLSSVVDVHTKEGNMKEYHGSASIGLISGNLSLEGPIIKDRTSFHIALRRTWLDVLTAPALAIANNKQKKEGNRTTLRYAFHDLNLKINHRFSERSRMYISLYNGNDVLKAGSAEFPGKRGGTYYLNENQASMRWGNMVASAGWTYVFNNRLFGKISGVYTQYRSKITNVQTDIAGEQGSENYFKSFNETTNLTGITDYGLRASFDYLPSPSHHIRFGGDYLLHRFRPEYNQLKAGGIGGADSMQVNQVYTNDLLWANEAGAFVEDDWTISPVLRLNAGLRLSLFNVERKTYAGIEPRLSLRWLIAKNLSAKTSYARMNQYVHLISNSYLNLPTDSWMPVTRKLKPLISDQVSAGLYYNLNNNFDFSVEGYYKRMHNLLEYKDGYTFIPTSTGWEDKMAVGEGRAYGTEFMVRKQIGRTTGWIGYTLAWADRKFNDINGGKRFPSRFDNRHKLNIVVMYKLSSKVELSAAWTYTSGNRATLSLENYEGGGSLTNPDQTMSSGSDELNLYGERNNYQLPAYHRLDLGINIYRPKKKGRMGIWNVSIYNAYSRMNPFMIYKTTKEVKVPTNNGGYEQTKSVPCFKLIGIMPILPSISYTYKF